MSDWSNSDICKCCPAKAKFDISGFGGVCGRHLAYGVSLNGDLSGGSVIVNVVKP